MASQDDLLIRIRADVKQALRDIEAFKVGLGTVGKSGREAAQGLGATGKSGDEAAQGLGATGKAGEEASRGLGATGKAGDEAAQGLDAAGKSGDEAAQGLGATGKSGDEAAQGLDATGKAGKESARGLDETASGANRASDKIRQVNESAKRGLSVFHELRNVFVAAFAVHEVASFIHSLAQANVEAQRIEYTLQSVTGSAKGARQQFAYVTKVSKQLGLDLQTTAQGYARVAVSAKSAGISNKELQKDFKGLADTFTVLHTPAQDVNGLLVQLEQGLSLGKLQMQDFRAIAQHLPGTMELAKQAAHNLGGSLQTMLANGGVPAKQFFEAFTALLRDKYGPEAKKASHSLNAEMNRLSTTLFQAETQGNSFADTFTHAIANLNKTLNDPGVRKGLESLISGLGNIVDLSVSVAAKLGDVTNAIRRTTREAARLSGHGPDTSTNAGKLQSIGQKITNDKQALHAGVLTRTRFFSSKGLFHVFSHKEIQKDIDRLKAKRDALLKSMHMTGPSSTQSADPATGHPGRSINQLQRSVFLANHNQDPLTALLGSNIPSSSGGSGASNATAGQTAAQQRAASIKRIISALTQQRDAIGKTANEQKIARLQELGASKATIDHARAIQQSIAQQKADAAQKTQDAQAAKQAQQQRQQFVNQIKSSIDPARQYRQELARLNKVYQNSNQLGPAQYAKAVAMLQDKIKNAGQQANKTSNTLDQFGVSAARNIQSSIARGLQFNKLNHGFKGLLHTAASTFEQIAAQAASVDIADKLFGKGFASGNGQIGGLVGNLFGGGKGASKGGGSFLGSIGSLFGSAGSGLGGLASTGVSLLGSFLHDGGLVTHGAGRQQAVPLGAFAGAPRLHGGGSIGLKPDEVPAVLQTGERVQSRAEVAATGKASPSQTHIHVWSMDQAAHELAKVPAFHEAIVHTVGDNPHAIQSTWNNG